MNGAASTPWLPSTTGGGRWLFAGLVVLGGAATISAATVTNGDILATMAPVLCAGVLVAVWAAPLRLTLFGLTFLALAIDASEEGPWDSPFAHLGRLVNHNLNKTVFLGPVGSVPLQTYALGFLLVIHLYRLVSRSRTDGGVLAAPMRLAMAVSLLAVVAECLNGFRNGGDMQMAKVQVQDFVLILLTGYLMAVSLRGSRDYRFFGAIVVFSALSKALIAIYVYRTMVPHPATATTHGDSLLFTCAAIMLIAQFAEKPVWRNGMLCLMILPVILMGMIANNRRLVWVQLAFSVLALFFVSRRSPLKRFVIRAVLMSVPVFLLYVAVGWNSSARIFAPVKTFRSIGDSEVDPSTLFRDLENFNLLYTLRANPIIGTGFGHPFGGPVVLPDISFFKEYHFMPHNSILGLWCFTGVIGFTGLFVAVVAGVHMAARSYYLARRPDERIAAFTALAMVLIYLIHCYGDIGFSEREAILLVGSALAVAGQLYVSTGAAGGWALAGGREPR